MVSLCCLRVATRDGEVGEDYHHDFPLLPVGTTLNVELSVLVTESTQLLDSQLPLELIEDDDIIGFSREANPIIVIGSHEDPESLVLPGLQQRSLSSIWRTPNPIVSLLLFRLERIVSRPPV